MGMLRLCLCVHTCVVSARHEGRPVTTFEYLTNKDLGAFMKRPHKPDGSILQKFVDPRGVHNSMIRVDWSQQVGRVAMLHMHPCMCEVRSKRHGCCCCCCCCCCLRAWFPFCLLGVLLLLLVVRRQMLVLEKRENVTRLGDQGLDIYQRVVTFEGAAHNSVSGASVRVCVRVCVCARLWVCINEWMLFDARCSDVTFD